MCGEIETDQSRAEEFYARFVRHARSFLADTTAERSEDDAGRLYAYLDTLFRDALSAAAAQEEAPKDVTGYQRLCMEPLVYARLAGFMAAHQPLEEDPLRRLIEALMTGYSEGEAFMSEHPPRAHGHPHTH